MGNPFRPVFDRYGFADLIDTVNRKKPYPYRDPDSFANRLRRLRDELEAIASQAFHLVGLVFQVVGDRIEARERLRIILRVKADEERAEREYAQGLVNNLTVQGGKIIWRCSQCGFETLDGDEYDDHATLGACAPPEAVPEPISATDPKLYDSSRIEWKPPAFVRVGGVGWITNHHPCANLDANPAAALQVENAEAVDEGGDEADNLAFTGMFSDEDDEVEA